jgi:hypothetical protein
MTALSFEYSGNNTWNMVGATPSITGTIIASNSGFYATVTIDGVTKSYNMNPYIRYRKLYNDYTFSKAAGNCSTITPVNSCRVPESGSCPDLGASCSAIQLNVPTYNVLSCDPCSCAGGGRPIDIDVGCIVDGTLKYKPNSNDLNNPNNITLCFDARSNPVPVINNVLYDTTTAPSGTRFILHTANSIEDLRSWVCQNLRFVDIKNPELLSSKPCCAIESNWPFNDLYSNQHGCTVGVPC